MDKVLTIVIPTYNMEKYLDRCLTSLIVEDEMMDCLEVLVVNDGSKDRSSEIAHGYESRYPQTFRVIDKENGNYGSCVNRGLAEATGKYIKVLDADDWFDTQSFVDYISYLTEVDVDFVFNGMSMVDMSGNVFDRYCFEDRLSEFPQLPFKEYSIKMNGAGVYMQNVAYSLQRIKEINYRQTEGISYTDQEWLFVPLFAVRSVAYFPQSLYCYLVGRDGQTVDINSHTKNMWMEIIVTKNIVKSYTINKNGVKDEDVASYLFGRMMSRVCFLYSTYLLSSRKRLNIDDLIEFDDFVSLTDKGIYEKSNEISARFGIKYVKHWRRYINFKRYISSIFHH